MIHTISSWKWASWKTFNWRVSKRTSLISRHLCLGMGSMRRIWMASEVLIQATWTYWLLKKAWSTLISLSRPSTTQQACLCLWCQVQMMAVNSVVCQPPCSVQTCQASTKMLVEFWTAKDQARPCKGAIRALCFWVLTRASVSLSSKEAWPMLKERNLQTALLSATWSAASEKLMRKQTSNRWSCSTHEVMKATRPTWKTSLWTQSSQVKTKLLTCSTVMARSTTWTWRWSSIRRRNWTISRFDSSISSRRIKALKTKRLTWKLSITTLKCTLRDPSMLSGRSSPPTASLVASSISSPSTLAPKSRWESSLVSSSVARSLTNRALSLLKKR